MKKCFVVFSFAMMLGVLSSPPVSGAVYTPADVRSWKTEQGKKLIYSTGFEKGSTKGIQLSPGAAFVRGAGNTGNTALKLQGKRIKAYLFLPKGTCQPGIMYQVSLFVRGNVHSTDGRKHASYRFVQVDYTDRKTGKPVPWQNGIFPFTDCPNDKDDIFSFKEFSFQFPGKKDWDPYLVLTTGYDQHEGTVYFDDLRIWQTGVDAHINLAQPAMHSFKNGNRKFTLYAEAPGIEQTLVLAILKNGEKTVQELLLSRGKDGFFRGELQKKLPCGNLNLEVFFADSGKKTILKHSVFPVNILPDDAKPPIGAVSFAGDGRILVDGKPFFGMGISCSSPWLHHHLKHHVEAGFNILDAGPFNLVAHDRKDHQTEFLKKLDILHQMGLKIRLNLCAFLTRPQWCSQYGFGPEGAVKVVRLVKKHPAILGYYLMDEETEKMWPQGIALMNAIHKEDPWHPCYVCTNLLGTLPKISQTCDVIGFDHYPIRKKSELIKHSGIVSAVKKAADRTGIHFYAISQAFNWAFYSNVHSRKEYLDFRDPTVNQMYADGVLFALNGAKDFWFFTCPVWEPTLKKTAQLEDKDAPARMLKKQHAMAKALGKLAPFLISGISPVPAKFDAPAGVEFYANFYQDGKGRKLLLVFGNGTGKVKIRGLEMSNAHSEFGFLKSIGKGCYEFDCREFCADALIGR